MGASILYQTVKAKSLSVASPQNFMLALERLGCSLPCAFGPHDVAKLTAFAAGLDDENQRRAIERLIDEIGETSTVNVWAEY